ncbi:MAG: hypothetical protein ACRDJI_03415, partial [Actinomycetota bacterium]
MRRFFYLFAAGALVVAGLVPAWAEPRRPLPDPAFLEPVPGDKCTPEGFYEKQGWSSQASAQAGKKCERLHFSYG